MLRYLTHKLRTQSLNETEAFRHAKTDDDRDSGTESDDEGAEIEELQKYMESIIHLDSSRRRGGGGARRAPSPRQVTAGGGARHPPRHQHHRPRRRPHRSPEPAPPSDRGDLSLESHHSSEEELEGINGGPPPEKRKWAGGGGEPVQFRSSPPAGARRPGQRCALPLPADCIPAHELCSVSPRKRHRRTPTVPRPCLDFEKMQQVTLVVSVTPRRCDALAGKRP